MIISDILPTNETKMIFGRKGKSVVKKYRCSFGRKKGRIVSNPSVCSAPLDIKKRMIMKKMKARMGARLQRKIKFTKRFNPASRRVASLNKSLRRK
ncbi:MAG: hypothetical protein CBD69_000430 [Crocinitomicaceae bacterium TMED209]|nr:MAG: hypothetical protein CBD69_000430 [Crocinitomicaceae bacterium TMED209]|tara:strand:- start:162 stop:449 length:288 start_codon:yes stop_codon:yes gene_type:complete